MNYPEEDEEEYDEEYKEQFRNMTDEEVEKHIGLEKVRNVMEGHDKEHSIDKIRRIVKEVRDEEIEKKIENEVKIRLLTLMTYGLQEQEKNMTR